VPIVSLILLLVGAYLSTRLDVFNSPPSGVKTVQETVPKAAPERERTVSQEQKLGPAVKAPSDLISPEWLNRAARKRNSLSPLPPDILFQEALGLIQIGEYEQARGCFRKFTREHTDNPLMYSAFLGIAESYRLEGETSLRKAGSGIPGSHRQEGLDHLREAGLAYRNFFVFFPENELAPYARKRFAELEPVVKAGPSSRRNAP